ncbi:hypothetical protein BU26DRAFT_294618 [Trematosphaeria pertusa]|uniref:Uncharacterized protein n=1 Tax=Trematosphaeria pertusa TaxID=390896 RepID=A0A6A6IHG7_9PLEO|nr:uncharacterized protein BU26DRAFT_294618 [Trematosphaeria pertusa]KAF2250034.1 hypothetical protein BU26DRAFT_294618 [Trematosphaeria pertusa]
MRSERWSSALRCRLSSAPHSHPRHNHNQLYHLVISCAFPLSWPSDATPSSGNAWPAFRSSLAHVTSSSSVEPVHLPSKGVSYWTGQNTRTRSISSFLQ